MAKRKRTTKKEPVKKPVIIEDKIGLGDIVEKVTEATGIKKLVEIFTPEGEDCGCDGRKKKLNTIEFTYRKTEQVRCFTEKMYKDYSDYRKIRTLNYQPEHVKLLIDLYAHVFARQYNQSDLCINCNGSYKIIKQMEERLDIVYNSYE